MATRRTGDSAGAASEELAAHASGLSKSFGGAMALRGVDLTIGRGRVHALVGENGAGKSTCLGILAGRVVPDAGSVELFGSRAPTGNPKATRRAGVASIYQELTIVPELSTQANVFLGIDRKRMGILRERDMVREFRQVCERLAVEMPANVPAGTLSIADQQLLEVMRALTLDPRLILFDEPTASLAPREREVLYGIVRSMRSEGRTVVFVSHNLDEVLALSDTVSVFRDGMVVDERPVDRWTNEALVEAMLAEEISASGRFRQAPRVAPSDEKVLAVDGLSAGAVVRDVGIGVRRGEILGIAGLVGSGRSTILRSIGGSQRDASGTMEIAGERVRWPRSPRAAGGHGIFAIPEERRRSGLVMELSGLANIMLSNVGMSARFGFIGRHSGGKPVRDAARAVHLDVERLAEPVANLSGGNQQKVLLARAVYRKPLVLLADEPTRGVDVGAKAEIAESLRGMAAGGMSIVMVSSEFEELEEICDRVIVVARGRVVGSLEGDSIGVDEMLRLAFQRPGDEAA